MRALVGWVVVLGLAVAPAMAAAGGSGGGASEAAKNNDAAAANTKTGDASATASKTEAPAKPEAASMENELQQLRVLLESQAKQLQLQNEQLKEQQQRMQALEEQLKSVNGSRENVSAAISVPSTASSNSALAVNPVNAAVAVSNNSANQDTKSEEPTSLHFKGITLTPGGFMAAETVRRSKALSADVNTPFNSAPMPGASNSNISEFNASGRQSRISMLVEGKLTNVKIGGYYEGDFLGAGSTSNNNQSNSYVFRQRQFWAQAAFDNGFKVTGGQMWSLLTETSKGLDNRTENLPQTIDAQYHIGFSWARQYGLRFTKDFGDKFWLGFSVEGPQTTFTVHGNPTTTITTGAITVLVPCTAGATPPCTATVGGTSTTYTNFLLGATGASGGLYNPLGNYSYNAAPDLVFKAAAEPGFGHYEIFGVVSRFRDRVFPCEVGVSATSPCPDGTTTPSADLAFNDARTGGGVGANARWALFAKHVDLGVHFLGGSGIGRYGSGGLPDATIRPDGTIALLRNYQGLGTLQFHLTPKFDINLNAGGEYSARAAYTTSAGKAEGFGNPGFNNAGCYTEIGPTTSVPAGTTGSQGYIPGSLAGCTADTRNLIEGSLGFWYRFYKGPRGTMQFGMQYSYYVRNTWAGSAPTTGPGAGDGTPHSVENLWFTSLRYYLP
jgi:hypothetical protein